MLESRSRSAERKEDGQENVEYRKAKRKLTKIKKHIKMCFSTLEMPEPSRRTKASEKKFIPKIIPNGIDLNPFGDL